MGRIDHLSVAIDAGFAVKESEVVCPVSKLCRMRAHSRAADVELAKFELHCNAYRPHQALGQRTPMQAYHEHFNQSALAA